MLIRIEATDLPGRDCPAEGDVPGRTEVHVAVQRRGRPGELLGLQPGDAASAVWELDCSVTRTSSGPDLRGSCLQGGPGARFVYLSWGSVDAAGGFAMFRRAKLMLDAVGPAVLEGAERSGLLVARLGLTDAKGLPLCAAVRPPLITWSAGPAGATRDA
jgi:hypothetical protein